MIDRAFGGDLGFMSMFLMLPYLLLGLAIPYMVIRLRDPRDPQAGFKAALHFFFSTAILLLLTGLTTIVVDAIMQLDMGPRGAGFQPRDEPFPSSAQRTGFALVISGSLFAIVHFLCILTLTRDPFRSAVRRTFLGWRFAVHGVVVGFALTILLIALFQRRDMQMDEMRRVLIGVLLVWAPSWVIHFALLRSASPATLPRQWKPEDERQRGPERDEDYPTQTERD